MIDQVTLQINISPGDINYAALTVPALVSNHRELKNRLLVVDCCRPQKTKLIDPDVRFPAPIFQEKVDKIIKIAEQLLKDGVVSEVRYLYPNDPLFQQLSKKYLANLYDFTHSVGGTANMSYWAGIELARTKFVLHYDGDIILHQKENYSWVNEALEYLAKEEKAIAAVPRLSPPIPNSDLPSHHEGRPLISLEKYWLNDWFSTRHFLLDKEKLQPFLPLVNGKVKWELLLRKYAKRAFPIDPEILLFKSLGPKGCKRIILKNENAWITHPKDKPTAYLNILPAIISAVTKGEYPIAQQGYENIDVPAWEEFVQQENGA